MARLPRPGPFAEEALFRRNVQIGADGSILRDGSLVYCVREWGMPLRYRIQRIDYFHGMMGGVPIAQTYDELDVAACDVIAITGRGFVVERIRHLQVRFRSWRARSERYYKRMIAMGTILAHAYFRSQRRIYPSQEATVGMPSIP